jgi:hypothetical protein
VQTAAAKGQIREFVGVINGVPTFRTVTLNVVSNVNAAVANVRSALSSIGAAAIAPKKAKADGSLTLDSGVRAMASGGIVGRDSMIMRSTKPILWNEAPGGEAYISLAPAKRQRSRAIWEETGKALGMSGGSSLAGIVITGTLMTPFGPADVRGVVQQEMDTQAREVQIGGRR